jgi:hypothetical protein
VCVTASELPDGIFPRQTYQFGNILEGLGIENVDILCGHLENFATMWFVLWPLCTFCGHFVNLLTILVFCAKKSGNPDLHT